MSTMIRADHLSALPLPDDASQWSTRLRLTLAAIAAGNAPGFLPERADEHEWHDVPRFDHWARGDAQQVWSWNPRLLRESNRDKLARGVVLAPMTRDHYIAGTAVRGHWSDAMVPTVGPDARSAREARRRADRRERFRNLVRVATTETRGTYRDGNLTPVSHRDAYPDHYLPPVIEPGYASTSRPIIRGRGIQHTSCVLSTPYVREIGTDDEGKRVVDWVPAPEAPRDKRSRETRAVAMLERAADAFLREHGEQVTRLDVIDRWTKLPTVAPDRVAFRGTVRVPPASKVRIRVTADDAYARAVLDHYRATRRALREGSDVPDRPMRERFKGTTIRYASCVRYRVAAPDRVTVIRGACAAQYAYPTRFYRLPADVLPRTVYAYRTDRVGEGFYWSGHERVSNPPAARKARYGAKRSAVKRARRGEATGTRGVARTGWTLSERSLPRAWQSADAGQVAVATWIADALHLHAANDPQIDRVRFGPDLVALLIDDGRVARVTAHGPSAPMTFATFARRAALAREAIED